LTRGGAETIRRNHFGGEHGIKKRPGWKDWRTKTGKDEKKGARGPLGFGRGDENLSTGPKGDGGRGQGVCPQSGSDLFKSRRGGKLEKKEV